MFKIIGKFLKGSFKELTFTYTIPKINHEIIRFEFQREHCQEIKAGCVLITYFTIFLDHCYYTTFVKQ